jgi:hypothetical protein
MISKDIGQTRKYTLKNLKSFGITPLRQVLSPELFHAAQQNHTRVSTVLIPEVVFWLMATVSLAQESMTGAITAFWSDIRATMPFLSPTPITEEAFCIARRKLKLRFFKNIFSSVIQRYQEKHLTDGYDWRGFRLLGIDGMKMALPSSAKLKKYFPPASNHKGDNKAAQGLLVGLVGLWDGICYDFKLVSNKGSEQKCARNMIRRVLGQGDLLMCDRNFPDYLTLSLISSLKADYLFHLASNRFHKLSRTKTASGRDDEWYIVLCLPKKLQKQFPDLPVEVTARVIYYQRKGFRPSLLITSLLDTEIYIYEEIVNLYHERWRHETMHREWKYSLSMSSFRSTTVQGIFKEVYVQLTINNVLRWLMSEAGELSDCRPVDLKFLECKRLLMSYLCVMNTAPLKLLPYLYNSLIENMSKQKIIVRPGRSYRRKNDDKPRNKGNGKYALPARVTEEGAAA